MTQKKDLTLETTKGSETFDLASREGKSRAVQPDILSHTIDRSLEDTSFPTPENEWLARGVQHQNWSKFIAELVEASAPSNPRGDIEKVLAEWNSKVFLPVHCKAELTSASDTAKESQESDQGGRGFGFKVGKCFVGVSTGKNSNGVGLKLGPVLIGVATGSSDSNS